MASSYESVNQFLYKMEMDYQSIDIDSSCSQFIGEMKNGLSGSASSFKMIPTYLSVGGDIPTEKPVIVLDAGGTNFRVAVLRFDSEGKPRIESYNKYDMPGVDEEITSDEFFEVIISYLSPVLDCSDKIGFCFSYAAEPAPNMDSVIIAMGKQLKIKGFIGKSLGQGLKDALKKHGMPADKQIVVLNDSVATLLGGKALSGERVFDGYIGFILGTGTNTCYTETVENIQKLPLNTAGSMIINIETGGYANFKRSAIDALHDAGTMDPGRYAYEKMISGRYQGSLLLTMIRKAMQENVFSAGFEKNLEETMTALSAKEIDEFLYYPYGKNKLSNCCCSEQDRTSLYYLIDALIERAAKLVLINLASVMIMTGTGKNPCRPVCITVEGSTFYNSKLFQGKLAYYIKKYLNDERRLYCEIVKAENATLIGTAIAALIN